MARRGTLALALYGGATRLAAPLVPAFLARRARRGKEDPERIGERLGYPGQARPTGPLVWVHAASVGETNTMLPLVRRLMDERVTVLVTTVTVTAARICAAKLPVGALHQFLPVDTPGAVGRFLDHWRPDLILFAEQEIWPNLLREIARRDIPAALVNGRMSPRSARGWMRLRGTAAALMRTFSLVLAQSEADAGRLRMVGAPHCSAPGNLKLDVPAPPADPADLARLTGALAGRPVWVAASTQPGEEALVLEAHRGVQARVPGAALLLAPRHPPRADEVEAVVRAQGWTCARRSRGEWPGAGEDVFLLDTIGELGLLYRAARVVFMGGSLIVHGGQNPIEPAKLGALVIHGPHVHNFADLYAQLDAADADVPVHDVPSLAAAVAGALADPAAAEARRRRGEALVESLGGGLDRTMTALAPLIAQARGLPS